MAGVFISLEGGEGTGKSTLLKGLADELERRDVPVCLTREPGGNIGADALRQLLLSPPEGIVWSAKSEAYIVSAARHEHVTSIIEPALDDGLWVITDRFADSTRVYQGLVGGLDHDFIENAISGATEGLEPEVTFLLDAAPADLMDRRRQRDQSDVFEARGIAYHERIRDGFLSLAERYEHRIIVLDALLTPEALVEAAMAHLERRIEFVE